MTDERTREVLQEQIDKYGQEYDDKGIEALKTAIKLIDQYKENLQSAYNSGYNCGYTDAMSDISM